MITKKSGVVLIGCCLMGCLVVACPTQAEEFGGVKDGYYLEGLFAYNLMSGDFDGWGAIYRQGDLDDKKIDKDVIDIPDVDNGVGFGIVLGRRFNKVSFELGYQRSAHDTEFDESDAAYNVVDLNVKFDVFAQGRLRPYVLLGAGFPWLTIDNNTFKPDNTTPEENDGTWDDSKFTGFCLNAGVGVAYYFDPQWALMAGLIHRWNWFTHGDNARIDPDQEERAFGVNVGLAYTF